MPAGYSGRSAAVKLGIRDDTRVALLAAPNEWVPEGLPTGVEIRRDLRATSDVTIAFIRSAAEVSRLVNRLDKALADDASLWIAWPRKAGGHTSDVTENGLRDAFLPRGLVDVKVAAIDEDWSGLKFVRRKELRSTPR